MKKPNTYKFPFVEKPKLNQWNCVFIPLIGPAWQQKLIVYWEQCSAVD